MDEEEVLDVEDTTEDPVWPGEEGHKFICTFKAELSGGNNINAQRAADSAASALASEEAAAASEANAAESEANAAVSARRAAANAAGAAQSERNAAASEEAAALSETNAASSAEAAEASKEAAAESKASANASKTSAARSAEAAAASETNAEQSAENAAASASAASASAESAAESARSALTQGNRSMTNASAAAQSARDAAASEENAAQSEASAAQHLADIVQQVEEFEGVRVTATTLESGSEATAAYDAGALTLGIPRGEKGASAHVGVIADEFSEEENYVIGNYVINGDYTYRFKADHPAGAWNDAHVDKILIGDSKADVKDTVLETTLSRGRIGTVGNGSFAFGNDVAASGNYSHAEGYGAAAEGHYSHAEGQYTVASGLYSHAEGWGHRVGADILHTVASGKGSHAEGAVTTASGDYAHAEGNMTEASGTSSHAQGLGTVAYGPYMHVSGAYNLIGENYPAWVAKTDYVIGDKVVKYDNGYECIEANSDSTFNSTKWKRLPSTSDLSVIVGNGLITSAAGEPERSNAFQMDWSGNGEFAGDVKAFACGGENPISISGIVGRFDTKADKTDTVLETTLSHGRKEGSNVGRSSFAFGENVVASGVCSFASGSSVTATGSDSHAEGSMSYATGLNTHAESTGIANGDNSHAEGVGTAVGNTSHAEGRGTVARGMYSHAEGGAEIQYCPLTGAANSTSYTVGGTFVPEKGMVFTESGVSAIVNSFDADTRTVVLSKTLSSEALDKNVLIHKNGIAAGRSSHVENEGNFANGDYSHAEGFGTIANLQTMHVSGSYNVEGTPYDEWVSGTNYVAGKRVSRNGYGYECITPNSDTVFTASNWKHVIQDGNEIFVVGNGTANNDRSNAFKVTTNGNGEFQGDVIANGNGGSDPVSLTTVNNSLNTVKNSIPKTESLSANTFQGYMTETSCTTVEVTDAYRYGNIVSLKIDVTHPAQASSMYYIRFGNLPYYLYPVCDSGGTGYNCAKFVYISNALINNVSTPTIRYVTDNAGTYDSLLFTYIATGEAPNVQPV